MYNTKKSIFQIIKISVPIQASLYCYMQYKAKKKKKKHQKLIQMSVGFSLHLHFRMKTDTKKPDIITLLFACWLVFFFSLVLFLPLSLTYFLKAGIYIYRPATGFCL